MSSESEAACRPDAVAEKQLPAFLDAALLHYILDENLPDDPIEVDSFTAAIATKPGDNYSSDVYRIVVHYNGSKVIPLVAKIMSEDPTVKEFGQRIGAFMKEVYTCRNLLPIFSQIVSRGSTRIKFGAHCVYATRDPADTVVFQDLNALGYRMPDRTRGGLDLAHCELIMRKIGLFHAASMVYVARGPMERQLFTYQYSHGMVQPRDNVSNNPGLKMFANGLDTFLEVSAGWPELKREIWTKLKALRLTYAKRCAQCLLTERHDQPEVTFRVLNHGDLWTNNMMFRYEDAADEGTVSDVLFVDYQLGSYGSPGLDLVYCLHNCPQFEVRESSTDRLLRLYHESLCEGLSNGGYKQSFPTFEDVLKEYERHEFIGLVSGLSMLPIILMERTDEVELTMGNLVDGEQAVKIRNIQYQGKQYRQSVIPILERFHAKGLLN